MFHQTIIFSKTGDYLPVSGHHQNVALGPGENITVFIHNFPLTNGILQIPLNNGCYNKQKKNTKQKIKELIRELCVCACSSLVVTYVK